jgi:hypothetical protein
MGRSSPFFTLRFGYFGFPQCLGAGNFQLARLVFLSIRGTNGALLACNPLHDLSENCA